MKRISNVMHKMIDYLFDAIVALAFILVLSGVLSVPIYFVWNLVTLLVDSMPKIPICEIWIWITIVMVVFIVIVITLCNYLTKERRNNEKRH